MKKLIVTLFLTALSSQVLAKDKVIFSCLDSKNKQIQVTQQNDKYRYSYGKKGKPELIFEQKVDQAQKQLWSGAGRAIWQGISLKNGDYFYTIYNSLDRLTENAKMEAGLEIEKGKVYDETQAVKSIECKKSIVVNFPKEFMNLNQ